MEVHNIQGPFFTHAPKTWKLMSNSHSPRHLCWKINGIINFRLSLWPSVCQCYVCIV